MELAPQLVSAWLDRAKLRDRLGDVAGAIADYERALTLAPRAGWAAEVRERLAALRRTD